MNILVISSYPSDFYPHKSVFVYNLVQNLTRQYASAIIISPLRFWRKRKNRVSLPGNTNYGSENATVYRPKYLPFPNRFKLFSYSLGRLNLHTHYFSIKSIVDQSSFKPDIIYSHFLFPSGASAIKLAKFYEVPAVVALGESSMTKHENIYGKKKMKEVVSQFAGIISVSNSIRDYCSDKLDVPKSKIKVIPNAVDTNIFYPRDRKSMRNKYNFPQDKKIVAFTGHFNHRKGPLRLLNAINKLKNTKGVFIGTGKEIPKGDNVLFSSAVPPQIVPELLCTADIFALPTLDEGSCNAIFEAQACGLPIISSNIPSVREQVNGNSAILINPLSNHELSNAIGSLVNDKQKLISMSTESIEAVRNNTLTVRAKTIYDWLKSIQSKNNSIEN
jgi:glycosyltransferase involved in cell wall biosynthesis